MEDFLTIGYVTKPHGVDGRVKVEPLCNSSKRFSEIKSVFIEEGGKYAEYKISCVSISPDKVILKFENVDSPQKAELFRGKYLWIPRDMASPLSEDEYYWADIVGCEVVMEDTGKSLGKVCSILETGSNDVYIVKYKNSELCIPALKLYTRVDINNKKIYVKREGMEELLPDEV